MALRDFDLSPRFDGGIDEAEFTYMPPPVRDGFFVPSWMRPGGGDVRGTTPFQEIQLNPGTNYRLVDFTGKNDNTVLAQGSTPDELARIMQVVNTQLVPQGRRADWRLEQETGDGQFETIGGDLYNNSFLKNAAMMALPAGLAVLSGGLLGGPAAGLLGASKAVGLGAASGLGSTVGNLAVGRDLGTSLLSGGITGLTAGALSGIGGAGGGAAGGAKASTIPAGALSGAPMSAIPAGALSAPMSAIPAGAFAGLGGSGIGEILVTAPRQAISNALASGIGGAAAGGFDQFVSDNAGMIGDAAPQADPEIEVTAPRNIDTSGLAVGGLTVPAIGAIPNLGSPATVQPPRERDLLDYIQAGTGGLSVLSGLGGLLGIGGSGNAGGGIGGFNPNPGLVSYQPLNRTQNAATFDPFTYGQTGGEFRFFNDAAPQFQINQPSAPAAMIAPENPNTPRFARGGPVAGIGGGQDDLIDAKLSDGEYVFSAQDVSDLGDGSNAEGARKLNQMRKLIRKGAGRKNVKTIARPQKSVSSLLEAVR
jgi:hypothetical protein